MSHLLREFAPITEASWSLIDDEARERLTPALAARKLVDFAGPHGWEYSATNLGRTAPLADAPVDGLEAAQRRVLAAVELRAPFSLARGELRDADRGADDVDLDAARRGRASDRDGGEPRRVPRLAGRGHHRHRRDLVAPLDRARRGLRALPEPRRQGGRGAAARPASRARTASRSGPSAYTRVARDHRARRLPAASTTCARSSAGRSSGRPACRARSS